MVHPPRDRTLAQRTEGRGTLRESTAGTYSSLPVDGAARGFVRKCRIIDPCQSTQQMYSSWVRAEYREEPCRSALNRVAGMPFPWSLNPYMGCVHRCTFCYVRAFERRADRPAGEEYGRTIRVKVNVVFVLRRELACSGWRRELVAIGARAGAWKPWPERIHRSI